MKFLSDYDFVDLDVIFDQQIRKTAFFTEIKLKYTFQKFLERDKKVFILEKENEEMKKRIQELELQVKYMPGGDGYLEAEEHFHSIKFGNHK
jgi:hypothetical protein